MGRVVGPLFATLVVFAGVYVLGPPDLPAWPDFDLPDLLPAQAAADSDGGGGGCPAQVGDWSREQTGNAAIIAEVGRDMDMPDRAIVVALATAMQESRLYNTTDHPPGEDSAGLFQQRPSQGWGSHDEVMDPEHAARSFYSSLRRVDGWEDMRVTEAAQRVQRSAYPEAYQKWADDADRLSDELSGCGR